MRNVWNAERIEWHKCRRASNGREKYETNIMVLFSQKSALFHCHNPLPQAPCLAPLLQPSETIRAGSGFKMCYQRYLHCHHYGHLLGLACSVLWLIYIYIYFLVTS